MSITTVWHTTSVILSYLTIIGFLKQNDYFPYFEITSVCCLLLFLLYLFMAYSFVFKTNWVVKKLKLDKGYEDEHFVFNIQQSTVLKITICIVGTLMLINNVPVLINEVIYYFQVPLKFEKREYNRNTIYVITDTIKIIIALILILYSTAITRFIKKQNQENIIEGVKEEAKL
ncbi:hypothetical protein [Mucilaginibacter sp.]